MTAPQLLSRLRELGVEVSRQGDRLRLNGPSGAVTPALRAELATRKAELLRFLGKIERVEDSSGAANRLVMMQPQGTEPPLVLVHPVGGDVFCYAELARRLRPDRPLHALSSRGLDSDEPPATTIEAMASDYLAILQPLLERESTLVLGGWSMGGVVAFEMARQLSAQGRRVPPLMLLESYVPQAVERTDRQLLKLFSDDLGLELRLLSIDEDALLDERFELRIDYLFEKLQEANVPMPDGTIEQFHRRFLVFKANLRALESYSPQPYAGRIELMRCGIGYLDDDERPVDWRAVAEQVTVHALPGSHFFILKHPFVSTVADVLQSCLDSTATRSSEPRSD